MGLSGPGTAFDDLIVGGDGLIGRALADARRARGRRVAATTRRQGSEGAGRPLLDLAAPLDPDDLPGAVCCIITAATTSVVACRDHPAETRRVNVTAPISLAAELARRGTFVLYLSSNQVFGGHAPAQAADGAYSPVTEYGRQKADAERGLLAIDGDIAVLRLTKVIDGRLALFESWKRAIQGGERITPFLDMGIAPVELGAVVDVICRIVENRATGIFQLSGDRDLTYAECGARLAEIMAADAALVAPVAAADTDYPEPAIRFSSLDTARVTETFGVALRPSWDIIETALAA